MVVIGQALPTSDWGDKYSTNGGHIAFSSSDISRCGQHVLTVRIKSESSLFLQYYKFQTGSDVKELYIDLTFSTQT